MLDSMKIAWNSGPGFMLSHLILPAIGIGTFRLMTHGLCSNREASVCQPWHVYHRFPINALDFTSPIFIKGSKPRVGCPKFFLCYFSLLLT